MWPLCSKSCNGSCLPQINSQVIRMSPGLHQLALSLLASSLTPFPTLLTLQPSLWPPGFLRVLRLDVVLPPSLCTCYFFSGESFTHWLPPLLQVFSLRPSLTMNLNLHLLALSISPPLLDFSLQYLSPFNILSNPLIYFACLSFHLKFRLQGYGLFFYFCFITM